MQSSNPVLGRAFPKKGYAAQPPLFGRRTDDALENIYNAPSASSLQTGRMTIEDVVARTSFLFAILVAVGGTAWYFNMGMGVLLVGFIGAFILAMVNIFSKTVRPALIIAYAAFEGLALGTLSHFYETIYPGIVSQAVIGTLAAFAGVLFMYRSGRLRATPKFTRVLMGAAIGYIVLGLVSFASSFFGVGGGYGFYGTGIGLLLALGGVVIASLFLVLDFDQIENAVRAGVPESESWRAGFGLMVTLVWLYLEILRLLSILRRD